MQTDGQTDMTKLRVTFYNFAKALKKFQSTHVLTKITHMMWAMILFDRILNTAVRFKRMWATK
jgi:hypothetical protein